MLLVALGAEVLVYLVQAQDNTEQNKIHLQQLYQQYCQEIIHAFKPFAQKRTEILARLDGLKVMQVPRVVEVGLMNQV